MANIATEGSGLGYRYVRDPRAEAFLMAPRLAAITTDLPREKEWAIGPTLDQGQHGSCVGHGWAHWRNASPVQPPVPFTHADAVAYYDYAQSVDEWTDTPPEQGTSVQAGARAMMYVGALKEGYLWGKTVEDLVMWVGLIGPAVVGTLWLSEMQPDFNAFVTADGRIDGGHCYLCYGYGILTINGVEYVYLKFQNSWGGRWGDGGCFYMLASEYERLLNRGHYSICSALELAPAPVEPVPEPQPTPPQPEPEIQRQRVTPYQLSSRPAMYRGDYLEIYERRRGEEITRWKANPV